MCFDIISPRMVKAYKIVFLGNSSVGKTTLITQYLYRKVHSPAPTIGIDFLSTTVEIKGKSARLQLWDTAGQERFQSIIGNYTRNTFIAIIVFAMDDRQSLSRVKAWVDEFVLIHNKKEDVRLILVANKLDLKVEDADEILKEAEEISEEIGAHVVKTSALDQDGIKELIDIINILISEDLERTEEERDSMEQTGVLHARQRNGCC